MTKPIRILILEGSQSPPTFISNLILGLLENGCEVGLFGQDSKMRRPETQARHFTRIISRYHRFNFFRLVLDFCSIMLTKPRLLAQCRTLATKTGNPKTDMLRFLQLAKILKFSPAIIHVQWAAHLEEFRGLLDPSSPFKVVVSLRGRQINITPAIDKGTAALYRQWFPNVAAFHAVSKAIGEEACRYGAPPEKINVIYSPVPEVFTLAFAPTETPERMPLRILSVGRFHWKKGYGYALDAVKILKAKNIAVQYTIIAQGTIPDEIIHQLHRDGLKDCVQIVQGIPYGEMVGAMKRHSVLVLPSLEEGIANVVLEAMAVGLPVVSTDCGGMREVVIPNDTGLLVPRRDAEALAESLLAFHRMSHEEINRLRVNAWQKVKTDFLQTQQIQKFIQLYQSLT